MQIIELELSHDSLFCPVSGKQILYPDDIDETVPSLLGYALAEFAEEPNFSDDRLAKEWGEFVEKLEDNVDWEQLETFLKNYKHTTAIVFSITTGGIACGPVSSTAYFIIDMDARPKEDIRAEDLERETNFGLRFYDDKGEEIETLDGPGELGDVWMGTPDGPMTAALLMVPEDKIKPYLDANKIFYQKAGRIGIWEIDHDEYDVEEGTLILEQSKEKSREIAKEFGVHFFYFFDWDGVRFITIEDVDLDVSVVYARGVE